MYSYVDLRIIHLEMTTRCNSRCPQCPRNLSGGVENPWLPDATLNLADVRSIIPASLLRQLNYLYLCGSYGDPVVAPDTASVLKYFRESNPDLVLRMYTNGAARPADWWAELARLNVIVRFAIDGLEDTNHIYRQGTQWSHVWRAVNAFLDAGGEAEWAFIAFSHNEHQVEHSRQMAKELGFKRFILRKTRRFQHSTSGLRELRTPVHDLRGNVVFHLEPPRSPAYLADTISSSGSGSEYSAQLARTPIVCQAATQGMVYVTAEGLVFPCCWLGSLYPPHLDEKRPQIWDILDALPGGVSELRALGRGLRAVVESPFFQKRIPERWGPANRLKVCAAYCGACRSGASLTEEERF